MASANRLPANKHQVSGCSTCPLRNLVDEDDAYLLGEHESAYECGHPEVTGRDVTGEEGVPDFCPLDRAPLLLVIHPEADRG